MEKINAAKSIVISPFVNFLTFDYEFNPRGLSKK